MRRALEVRAAREGMRLSDHIKRELADLTRHAEPVPAKPRRPRSANIPEWWFR